jgi:DNA-directed RNA polymerase subunit M/transcription elongation factor TFIIS
MLTEHVFESKQIATIPAEGSPPLSRERGDAIAEQSRTRFRCSQCGNLTRFDVVESRRTRAYWHYSLGGDLTVEEEEVLSSQRERVTCRWCGSSDGIEELRQEEE